ncbi:MAG: DivIVA domain-containing protein [Acidimicrobiia bacterium]
MADDSARNLTERVADGAKSEVGTGALTPEEVAYRSFSAARRGVSEAEVREFLQDVAADLAAAVGRERDLMARVHELEQRVAHPPAPTEEQILDHLGEETARVLRSAQEAADEIRANASTRAQTIIEQAESEAGRIRQAAEAALGDKTREAEVAATVIHREAEGKAQADLRQAARDAEAEIAAARQRGRDMVGEARVVRERILSDLGKRRATLQGEVEQLRAARTELVEAGRVAKATLGGIVGALAAFDESTAPAPHVEPEQAERLVAELDAAAAQEADAEPPEQGGEDEDQAEAEEVVLEHGGEEPAPEPQEEDGPADAQVEAEGVAEVDADPAVSVRPQVEELFARIRSDRSEPTPEPEPEPDTDQEPTVAPSTDEGAGSPGPRTAGIAPEPRAERARPEEKDAGLLAGRDELLAPVQHDLVRRCKRVLQDEQNELLDRLRRQKKKGRAPVEELLIPLSVQVTDWADVLEPSVDEAYGAGRGSQEGTAMAGAPRRLVSGLAELLVTPLRERLLSTLDAVPGDAPDRVAELTSHVGARYREWRSQELEVRVGDVLTTAYTRGVYDAAPEGALLRWVPAAATRCPDCDDNALEPTPRGAPFPTGQPFPPAHPGCRCLVAVVEQ